MILINEVLVDPFGIDALKKGKWISQKSGTTVDGILLYTKQGATIPIECDSPEQAMREFNAACETIMQLDEERKARETDLSMKIGEMHAVCASLSKKAEELNKRQKENKKKLDNLSKAVAEVKKPVIIRPDKQVPVTGDIGEDMELKNYEEFGKKIEEYVEQKGITLNEFAESIGMSGVTMHRIVKGRIVVHAPMIIKIIKAMGMDVDEEMKEMFGAV